MHFNYDSRKPVRHVWPLRNVSLLSYVALAFQIDGVSKCLACIGARDLYDTATDTCYYIQSFQFLKSWSRCWCRVRCMCLFQCFITSK